MEVGEESVFLAGVELQGVEDVGEVEAVDDDSRFIGECAGLDNVHTPGGKGTGHVGKQAGTVAGDYREIEELAIGAQIELDGISFEIEGHLEVMTNLLGEAGLQVALGKAFEELAEGLILRGLNHGADAIQQRGVDGCVVADLV